MRWESWGGAGEVGLCHPLHFLLHSLYRLSVPHFPPGASGVMLPRDLPCHGGSGGNQHFFESVPTIKHNWAFSIIVSFAVSWQLHEVDFITFIAERLKLRL